MSKKELQSKNDSSSYLSLNQQQRDFAAGRGIDLSMPPAERWNVVVGHEMAAKRHFAAFGLLMLSLKNDIPHGDFVAEIEARRIEPRQAQRAMSYVIFIFKQPPVEQLKLLELPHTTVCTLAAADPDVIEMIMADGVENIDAASVRDLSQRNRELKIANVDLQVERDTLAAQRDGLAKQLKRRSAEAEDAHVPMVVADQRLELAALIKKAELSVNSMHPLGVEIVNLIGHDEAGVWVEPTLRLGVAGLLSLREVVDGTIKKYVEAMGESAKRLASQPDALAFLDDSEVGCLASEWATLTATHQHEAALRQHERDQAKPKGKGRPKAAPEAPETAAKARKAQQGLNHG